MIYWVIPPTCWPFNIPKTLEKVLLTLSCVKHNGLDGRTPPRFSLRSWEQLSKLLITFFPGVLLHCMEPTLIQNMPSRVSFCLSLREPSSGFGQVPVETWWGWEGYRLGGNIALCQRALACLAEAIPPPIF